jgi:hypothetical protein
VPDSLLPPVDSEPPVALDSSLELSELEPPVADDDSEPLELSLSVPPAADSSLSLELSLLSDSLSPVPVVEALVVAVVAVVLVRVASLSAVVLLGGVISGVLRGTASETLLPPHAASAAPQLKTSSRANNPARARAARVASSRVALTRPADPSAGHRLGSH